MLELFGVKYASTFDCERSECHRCDRCRDADRWDEMFTFGTDDTAYGSQEACVAAECTKEVQTCNVCEDPWMDILAASSLNLEYASANECIVDLCLQSSLLGDLTTCSACYDTAEKWSGETNPITGADYTSATVCEITECTVSDFCLPCYDGLFDESPFTYADYAECAAAECKATHFCDVCQDGSIWSQTIDPATGVFYDTEEQCVKDHCASAPFPCLACWDEPWNRDTFETQLECSASTECSDFDPSDSSGCPACVSEDWIVDGTTHNDKIDCIVAECTDTNSDLCDSGTSLIDPNSPSGADFNSNNQCKLHYLRNENSCTANCADNYDTLTDSRTGELYVSADACSTDLCVIPRCGLCETNFVDAFRTSYFSKEECRSYECHKCGDCPSHFDDWQFFPNTFYQDAGECEDVECDICSKCTTNFRNGFELEYNSIRECQEAHCDEHESCQLCQTAWDTAFRVQYKSAAECSANVCNHCSGCEASWDDNDYFLPIANNATHCQQLYCHKCSACHSDEWMFSRLPDNSRTYHTAEECKAFECFVESAETCAQFEDMDYSAYVDEDDLQKLGLRAMTNRVRGEYTDIASCEAIEKDGCKACPQWMVHFDGVYFSQAQCESELCHICSNCADYFDQDFLVKYTSVTECEARECTDWTCDLCDAHTETTPVVNPNAGRFIPYYDGASSDIPMQKREIVFFDSKDQCLAEMCYWPKCSDCEDTYATAFKVEYASQSQCEEQAFCHNIANCIDDFATAFLPVNSFADANTCVDTEAAYNLDPAEGNCEEGPCLVCSHCATSWDKMADDSAYTKFDALSDCLTKYCTATLDCGDCFDSTIYPFDFYTPYTSEYECIEKEQLCHTCDECSSNSDDTDYFAFAETSTTTSPTSTTTTYAVDRY